MKREPAARRQRRAFFHGLVIVIALVSAFYAIVLTQQHPGAQGAVVTHGALIGEAASFSARSAMQGFGSSESSAGAPQLTRAAAVATQTAEEQGLETQPHRERLPLVEELRRATEEDAAEQGRVQAPQLTQRPFEAQFTLSRLDLLCRPSDSPYYCVYTVQEGDTLGHIALLFGLDDGRLPGWELLAASNQPDIVSADDYIQPGQKLRVPTALGVVKPIILGESVSELAVQYDVTSQEIIAANDLADGDLITIGQVLFIPDPRQILSPEQLLAQTFAESEPAPAAEPSQGQESEPQQPSVEPPLPPAPPEVQPPAPAPPPQRPQSAHGFIWPIDATVRITNYMGPAHPLGIDMGLSHAPRTPILAVADGTVTFAGGDTCCSYGLYVIIDHGNGLKTLYAHLSRLDVSKGQWVSQGQSLGPAGSTGYSTGPHLHFEVHRNGTRVNPMNYLP